MPQPRPRRVAVVIEASNAYARGLLTGIHRHTQEHERWTIFLPEHGRGAPPLEPLGRWQGDGVIARIESTATAAVLGSFRTDRGIPIVDVSAGGLLPGVPCVETDDAAIARLAVDHFLDRDFRSFAFLGDSRFRWSDHRRHGFVDLLAARGHAVHVFPAPAATEADEDAIAAWLRELPKPLALLACYDVRGRQAIEACHRSGIAVPDEVAVLGVDDDELLCGLCSTPLSSIVPDAEGAGWLAADLLARLMQGETPERQLWLLPPLGLSARRSTDTLSTDDPLVVTALRLIREHACEGIKVADVVRAVKGTRRVVEARFQKRMGHSLHEAIARAQFRRVEELLRDTKLPLATIAERTGFKHPEYMTVAFTRRYGMPPSRWRARGPGGTGDS